MNIMVLEMKVNFLDFLNCLTKLFRLFHLSIYPKKLRMSLKFS